MPCFFWYSMLCFTRSVAIGSPVSASLPKSSSHTGSVRTRSLPIAAT